MSRSAQSHDVETHDACNTDRQYTNSNPDLIWLNFKTCCNQLRFAKNLKHRNKTFCQLQNFMSSEDHRYHVQKWRGWSLLLFSVLCSVKEDAKDVFKDLDVSLMKDIGSVKPGKRKAVKIAKIAKKRIFTVPKMNYWNYLCTLLGDANVAEGPILHLDANGCDVIEALVFFAISVIQCGIRVTKASPKNEELVGCNTNQQKQKIISLITATCWQILRSIFDHRVYCNVLAQSQVVLVFELAFKALDLTDKSELTPGEPYDNSPCPIESNPLFSASQQTQVAGVLKMLYKGLCFGLDDQMVVTHIQFFQSCVEVLAATMLQAVTKLSARHWDYDLSLMMIRSTGMGIIHFIQRAWRDTSYRLRGAYLDYLLLFCESLKQYQIGLSACTGEYGSNDIDNCNLFREMNTLLMLFSHPKQLGQYMQGVDVISRAFNFSCGQEDTTGISRTGKIVPDELYIDILTLHVEKHTYKFYQCAADIYYQHDELLKRVQSKQEVNYANPELDQTTAMNDSGLSVEPPSSQFAQNLLLTKLQALFDGKTFNPHTESSTEHAMDKGIPRHLRLKSAGSYIFLISSIVCRYGDIFDCTLDGNVLVGILLQCLESKTIEALQFLALLTLLKAVGNSKYQSKIDERMQLGIWQTLLRSDLPYAATTESAVIKDSAGNLVMQLLHACFTLLSVGFITRNQNRLWKLPIFALHTKPTMNNQTTPKMQRIGGVKSTRKESGHQLSVSPFIFISQFIVQFDLYEGDDECLQTSLAPQNPGSQLQTTRERLERTILFLLDLRSKNGMEFNLQSTASGDVFLLQSAIALIALLGRSYSRQVGNPSRNLEDFMQPDYLYAISQSSSKKNGYKTQMHETNSTKWTSCGGFVPSKEEEVARQIHQEFQPVCSQDIDSHDAPLAVVIYFEQMRSPKRTATKADHLDAYLESNRDNFFPIHTPPWLLDNQHFPESSNAIVEDKAIKSKKYTNFVSDSDAQALLVHLLAWMSSRIDTIGSSMNSTHSEPLASLAQLDRTLDMAYVVFALANFDLVAVFSITEKLEHLQQQLIGLILQHLSPEVLVELVRLNDTTASSVQHVFRRLETLFLISEGPNILIPEASLQSPARSWVNELAIKLGAFLESLVTNKEKTSNALLEANVVRKPPISFGWPSQESPFMKKRKAPVYNSLIDAQLPSFDDGPGGSYLTPGKEIDLLDESTGTRRGVAQAFIRHDIHVNVRIRALRLVTILDISFSLKILREVAQELQLTPEALIALACNLYCSHPTRQVSKSHYYECSDSIKRLSLFLRLLDCAIEDIDRKNTSTSLDANEFFSKDVTIEQTASDRVLAFYYQVFLALLQCLITFEKEKKSLLHLTSESTLPVDLTNMIQKVLECTAQVCSDTKYWTLQVIQLQVFEVCFRLDPEFASEFPDHCMQHLLHPVTIVRVIASRCLQSVFYMYPSGGAQIFSTLLQVLEEEYFSINHPVKSSDEPNCNLPWKLRVTWFLLYVCGASNIDVLPNVLAVFLWSLRQLFLHPMFDNTWNINSAAHEWLQSMATLYGYPSVIDMLDTHMLQVWMQWCLKVGLDGSIERPASIVEALEAFPAHILDPVSIQKGSNVKSIAPLAKRFFLRHLSVIVPVAILMQVRASLVHQDIKFHVTGTRDIYSYIVGDDHSVMRNFDLHCVSDSKALAAVLSAFGGRLENAGQRKFLTDFAQVIIRAINDENELVAEIASDQLTYTITKITQLCVSIYFPESWISSEELSTYSTVLVPLSRGHDDRILWKTAVQKLETKFDLIPTHIIAKCLDRINLPQLYAFLWFLLLTATCDFHSTRTEPAVDCLECLIDETQSIWIEQEALSRFIMHIIFTAAHHLLSNLSTTAKHSVNSILNYHKPVDRTPIVGTSIIDTTEQLTRILLTLSEILVREAASTQTLGGRLKWMIEHICAMMQYVTETQSLTKIKANLDALVLILIQVMEVSGNALLNPSSIPSGLSTNLDKLRLLSKEVDVKNARNYEIKYGKTLPGHPDESLPGPFDIQNARDELLRDIHDAKTLLKGGIDVSTLKVDDIAVMASRLLRSLLQQRINHADQEDIEMTYLRCLQAETLGELGALDPYVFSLSTGYESEELVQWRKRMIKQPEYNGTAHQNSNLLSSMHEVMLSELIRILFQLHSANRKLLPTFATVKVLRKVMSTLCRMMCSDFGKQAYVKWKCKEPGMKSLVQQLLSYDIIIWDEECLISEFASEPPQFTWTLPPKSGFSKWITHATASLLEECSSSDAELSSLSVYSPLVALQPDLACQLFPYIFHFNLQKHSNNNQLFTKMMNGLQTIHLCHEIQDTNAHLSVDLYAVQFLLHSLNFARERQKKEFMELSKLRPGRSSYFSCGILAHLDFLSIAQASIHVKMPCSAMQYVELWIERTYGALVNLSDVTQETPGQENLNKARNILLEAYQFDATNEDALDGINEKLSISHRILSHTHGHDYAKALPLLDALLQCSHFVGIDQLDNNFESLLHCLRRLGYEYLLGACANLTARPAIVGLESGIKLKLQEYEYEKRWCQLEWDRKSDLTALTSWPDHEDDKGDREYRHQCALFYALRALVKIDTEQTFGIIKESQLAILKSAQFAVCGLEQAADSHRTLLQLQHLKEVCDVTKQLLELDKEKSSARSWQVLLAQWFKRHDRTRGDYDSLETILRLEETLLKVSLQREWSRVEKQKSNARYLQQQSVDWSSEALAIIYISLASSSRKNKRIAIATKALLFLQEMDGNHKLSFEHMIQWRFEKSKILWAQHENRSAIQTAQLVRQQIDNSADPRHMLLVNVLTKLGKWLASQRSISSHVIINEYFLRATKIADCVPNSSGSPRVLVKAYGALGNYMADMYQQVQTRVSSNEWLAGKRVAEARDQELKACLDMSESKQLESRSHIHTLAKEIEFDHKERAKVESSVDEFLIGALQNYSKALQYTYTKGELAMIFRLLSLWFSNHHKQVVNETMHLVAESIPSYKFVPLSYQIVSRIGSGPNGAGFDSRELTFERVLSELVMKLAEQHPHHILVYLIALRNSADVEGRGAVEFRVNAGDAKAQVAEEYMDKLYNSDQGELLKGLHIVSQAYVTLALFDTQEEQKTSKRIPLSKVKLQVPTQSRPHGKLVSFDHYTRYILKRDRAVNEMPAIFTYTIEPRADMDYSDIARIQSFDPIFTITETGIHRPKIIYCFGSDGRRYKQLVKGLDDTRQDLVIEQMFVTMNKFLQEDAATNKRKLRIRTYKVVPLSPISGVLEWVDSTLPWGSYLVGRTGKSCSAHERYHPHEWKHMECRNYLQNAVDKLAAYQEIEANFTPVFHHYFLETYPDPAVWYQRRLAYTKSVAVNSIVGYIVGIGDRHSQNILIHEDSAELVHIDFGVVFDQALALFTPETIPFRLTRDIVDGMGATGCDGVFTRCAEETMRLLRNKSASVITILEVFVYDPLYRWTISPLKALRLQCNRPTVSERSKSLYAMNNSPENHINQDAQGNHNDAAARALLRVKQKLEGYEDPNGNALSVEGQVKYLVQQAQDPQNLSCLFPGWAPWM
uniref:non-specific serine/threonine protein kinase n=1 Tax=Albugo laibachii Nc14 TaxID=890382 RepID=F0WCD6_9STRA|nr:phosphatidylinositol kinase (PIK5) putative [Albugo laibachii Nc14]|eukprot:CCA18851.1 phosphatidylinositol kinase (PIK5) putative [Albugo laibachii Nc14]